MEACPMRGAPGLWHDEIEHVAEGVCCAITKESLCPTVPQTDHPSTIRKDDGVRSMLNQHCFQGGGLHASQRSMLWVWTILRLCLMRYQHTGSIMRLLPALPGSYRGALQPAMCAPRLRTA